MERQSFVTSICEESDVKIERAHETGYFRAAGMRVLCGARDLLGQCMLPIAAAKVRKESQMQVRTRIDYAQ